jgi:hypothetical protein
MPDRELAYAGIVINVGLLILLLGDFNHYTWWMVLEFWTVALLAYFNLDHLFAVVFLSQSILVLIGVVAMSMMECSMLHDTASYYGLAYAPLNFLVHYVPSLVVIASPPRNPITNYADQLVTGAAIFVAYALINNATLVYGCSFRRGVVPLLFTMASLAATYPPIERFALAVLTPCRYKQCNPKS